MKDACSPLDRIPYFQQAPVTIFAPLMIPESKDLNSLLR